MELMLEHINTGILSTSGPKLHSMNSNFNHCMLEHINTASYL